MWFQWGEQRDYMASSWGCGSFLGIDTVFIHVFYRVLGSLFVFLNLVVQLGASGMVLLWVKKHAI